MPTFDELLARHKKDIQQEINRHETKKKPQSPRKKNDTRPWDAQLPKHDLSEQTRPETSLAIVVKKRLKMAIMLWIALLIPAHTAITFIPKNYYSTLYLYAPEKTDSISSRLTLFYNRIEFASFPMELKMPISLLSRKLRQNEAQAWVTKTYFERNPSEPILLAPESVRVETGYITTSELLVIEGFANHPELAAKITYLYGEYFNLILKETVDEHFKKIQSWFAETDRNIDSEIEDILAQLGPISGQVGNVEINSLLNSRVNENAQNIEAKRLSLTLERNELLRASNAKDLSEVQGISDSDIQALLKIHNELSLGPDNLFYSQRTAEIETQINATIKQKLKEKNFHLKSLDNDRLVVDQQKSNNNLSFVKLSAAKQKEGSLLSQLNTLRAEKADLQKLKSQLNLDMVLQNSKTRILQKPVANGSSVRPQPMIYHMSGFALISIFVVLLMLMIEIFSRTHKKVKS